MLTKSPLEHNLQHVPFVLVMAINLEKEFQTILNRYSTIANI